MCVFVGVGWLLAFPLGEQGYESLGMARTSCLEENLSSVGNTAYAQERVRPMLGEGRMPLVFTKSCGNTAQQHLLLHSFRNSSSLVSSHKDLILMTLKVLKDNALCGSVDTIQGRAIQYALRYENV